MNRVSIFEVSYFISFDRNALLNIVSFSLLSQSSTNLSLMNAGIEEEDIIFVGEVIEELEVKEDCVI
jgi:hypothetical protein